MRYIVKREDICGKIDGYPIEIIQAAVDRGMEQGNDANLVIRGLQHSEAGGFDWSETPEGSRFWSRIMCIQEFNIFFQKYPRKFADGVHYFVIDKSKRYWVNVAKAYLGGRSRFAFKGNSGDVFYIVKYGDKTITGFAIKDTPRYRWAIENGTNIY